MAALNGQIDTVKILVDEFNCSPLMFNGLEMELSFMLLVRAITIELIDLLIRTYQLDPMGKDDDGNTPLHIAAQKGQVDTVKHLITEYEVKIDARNNQDNTPLCVAALNGQIDIIKILVEEFNCSPFVQGFRNGTLLHAACLNNNIELIDLLIRTYQVDPMGKDDDGKHTSTHCCSKRTSQHMYSKAFNYRVRG